MGPGRVIGDRYHLLELVGGGNFGTVYRARDLATGDLVAAKHFTDRDGGAHDIFWREVSLQLRLRHPHIVQLLNVVSEEGSPHVFTISEFVAGGNMRGWLRDRGPLDERDAVALLRPVASALAYAHARHIIHRDIKPENILCAADADDPDARLPVAKITDFGLARFLRPDDVAATHHGSPAYMAPEQFYGEYTHQSDIYAVGVILYELVRGERPFVGGARTLMKAHIYQPPPPLATGSVALRALVARLMHKEPARRFATMRDAERAMCALLGEAEGGREGGASVVEARPKPPPSRAACRPSPRDAALQALDEIDGGARPGEATLFPAATAAPAAAAAPAASEAAASKAAASEAAMVAAPQPAPAPPLHVAWRADLGIISPAPDGAHAARLLALDGVLLVHRPDGRLVAVDAATGTPRPLPDGCAETPVAVGASPDGAVLVAATSTAITIGRSTPDRPVFGSERGGGAHGHGAPTTTATTGATPRSLPLPPGTICAGDRLVVGPSGRHLLLLRSNPRLLDLEADAPAARPFSLGFAEEGADACAARGDDAARATEGVADEGHDDRGGGRLRDDPHGSDGRLGRRDEETRDDHRGNEGRNDFGGAALRKDRRGEDVRDDRGDGRGDAARTTLFFVAGRTIPRRVRRITVDDRGGLASIATVCRFPVAATTTTRHDGTPLLALFEAEAGRVVLVEARRTTLLGDVAWPAATPPTHLAAGVGGWAVAGGAHVVVVGWRDEPPSSALAPRPSPSPSSVPSPSSAPAPLPSCAPRSLALDGSVRALVALADGTFALLADDATGTNLALLRIDPRT